jgi:hypothetical protein
MTHQSKPFTLLPVMSKGPNLKVLIRYKQPRIMMEATVRRNQGNVDFLFILLYLSSSLIVECSNDELPDRFLIAFVIELATRREIVAYSDFN